MPAASEPRRSRTFRPFGVRVAVAVFGVLLFGSTLVIWFAFPANVRDQFTYFQRATVIAFGLAPRPTTPWPGPGGRADRRASRGQRLQVAPGWTGTRSSR